MTALPGLKGNMCSAKFGLFEFIRMPFGLRNAAQSFQRFMDEVTRGLPFVFTYIDDLLIASGDTRGA